METIALAGEIDLPRIGFGALYVTEGRGFGPVRANADALLREAASLGVRLFDTADSYGPGSSEEAIRAALHPYDGLVVATKGGFRHDTPGAWRRDARPARLRAALEGSLTRLGVETIDLYQLHCPDPRVAYADSVGTLRDLQAEGKIRHIGVSNVDVRQLETARREARIVSVQNPFHVGRADDPVIGRCEADGMAFLPWMPLGDGGLDWNDPVLRRIADEHGATPAQIALAALLHRSPAILPIPGTSSIDHLRENVGAGALRLDADDVDALWRRRPGRR